ncbi:hypothetical protein D3X12_12655 [Pseudomonas protegens]|jgi:uncharacterized RmlC-like cupin family protein|uniref:Uncharacterized protein n=2 Tax=Pseudomonas TaxID=286 RepID=A0ABY2VM62_9PSED|nr:MULTISPECIES: hypothetical protein [Pseudomonas]ASE18947.1 hypothetical protein CEP86_00035 [Pseudomonas protegens]MBB1613312.1 hypothetical protein [Pseudomonas sp. UMC65]MBB1619257.1 hypothetical protein [Pseudomonas sp. UME65]MBF0638922.1 hypothetical protein [Pseudomonas protegens]MBP5095906.1 hypothetical protein [Pseudomonas protegens]
MNNNKEKNPSNIATNRIGQILEHQRDTRPCDLFRLPPGLASTAIATLETAHSSMASRCTSGLLASRALLPG